MSIIAIVIGLALLAFDAYMSLTWTGFLIPQMVLALVALALILSGVTGILRSGGGRAP